MRSVLYFHSPSIQANLYLSLYHIHHLRLFLFCLDIYDVHRIILVRLLLIDTYFSLQLFCQVENVRYLIGDIGNSIFSLIWHHLRKFDNLLIKFW